MNEIVKNVLLSLNEKQIKRIKNTNKEYIYFYVSVFNAGSRVRLKCSDTYKNIPQNGYNFVLESTDANRCLTLLNL